jgi:hypothetical protein
VVWNSGGSAGTDASDRSIQGQRFAADGSQVGGEFQVNAYTTGRQLAPRAAMDVDGSFVVAWMSYGSPGTDTSEGSIQAQRFAPEPDAPLIALAALAALGIAVRARAAPCAEKDP